MGSSNVYISALDRNPFLGSEYISMNTLTQRSIYAIYVLIFLWLIVYSVLATVYSGTVYAPAANQPQHYEIENVTFTRVRCTFPNSSQYQTTPKYTFYLLFAFVIVFRGHEWLTVGAAASVMTYSGVAAIHMILLFPSNNRYDIDASKTHCDFIMLPGLQKPFVACNGVGDPDRTATFNIVSTALLGAVPMAAWSKTFRASSRKPILLLWVLLLSSSHVFFNLILPNVSYNFQICPRSHIESLPQTNYQAAPLDFTWHSSLYALVSGQRQQQSTRTVNETTTSSCLYSCFANGAYIGRSSREIGVYYQASDRPNTRWGAITIWWAFTAIGLITFFTAERPDLLPHVAHKSLFIFRPSPSVRTAWSKCFGRDDSRDGQQKEWQISAITVVRVFAQWLSAGAFIGTTIYNESRALDINAENFSAVGQWGGVAVVVQVLIAASVGYLWRTVKRDGPNTLGDGTRCTGSPTGGTGEISCVDEESGKEEWNCKVGYAS